MKYRIINYDDLAKNGYFDEYLTGETLNIMKKFSNNIDYEDVKKLLFKKDNIKLFIIDDNLKIKGVLVANYLIGYNDNTILYCENIIIDSEYQSCGLAKEMLYTLVKRYNPDVVIAKTHNPRVCDIFTKIPYRVCSYPNKYYEIPKDIYRLIESNPFIQNIDSNLIEKGSYESILLQQNSKNNDINKMFMNVDDYDAQVMVVVMHDNRLNLNAKMKVLKKQA